MTLWRRWLIVWHKLRYGKYWYEKAVHDSYHRHHDPKTNCRWCS